MSITEQTVRLWRGPAIDAVSERLEQQSLSRVEARRIAHALIEAESRLVPTHGLLRAPRYMEAIAAGEYTPYEPTTRERPAPWLSRLDGGNSLGYQPAWEATSAAIISARELGIGVATVRNIGEFGRAGYFAEAIANEGLIGLCCQNSLPMIAAPSTRVAVLGNNPLAYSVPGSDGPRFDAAFTPRAGGELLRRQILGLEVPLSWDYTTADGTPTTDPHVALATPQQAVGGPKGFGIALLVDVLAGALSGAESGPAVGQSLTDTGAFILALNPETFGTSVAGIADTQSRSAQAVRAAGGHWPGDRARSLSPSEVFSIGAGIFAHVVEHIPALESCVTSSPGADKSSDERT